MNIEKYVIILYTKNIGYKNMEDLTTFVESTELSFYICYYILERGDFFEV